MNLRAIFVAIYIIIDVIYVTLSRTAYENVAKDIQGSGFPVFKSTRIAAATIAYSSMILGWLILVAPLVEQKVATSKNIITAVKSSAFIGFIFGVLVYGVFNGTLHTMFEKYNTNIMVRDLVWGISWATVLTSIYGYVLYNKK